MTASKGDSKSGAGKAVVATLPAVAAQSAAEYPTTRLREYLTRTTGRKLGVRTPGSSRGRSTARILGRAGVSTLTLPLFLSGIGDLKSEDRRRRRKGLSKVLAGSAGFGLAMGGAEAVGAFGRKGLLSSPVGRRLAGYQAATSVLGGVVTARTLAKGYRKEKASPARAALLGAGVGGLTGALAAPLETRLGYRSLAQRTRRAALRRMLARGVGGAGAGTVATLALDQIAKRMIGKKP